MTNMFHMILGVSGKTPEILDFLKGQGKINIYVVDYEQSSKVREKNGVIYLSPDGASDFSKDSESVMYYQYKYITPDSRPRKRRKDKG